MRAPRMAGSTRTNGGSPAMSSGSSGGASPTGNGDLREAPSFDELHRVVREVGDRIHGIGVLAVYDTALRIGVKRGLLPTRVYLHRGPLSGAGALGIDRSYPVISISELPGPFANLKPHEIEDCLCIFKELLSGEKLLRPRDCRCSGRGCARRIRKATRSRC